MASSTLGLDIGGTKIFCGLVSPRGKIRQEKKFSTQINTSTKQVIANIIAAIRSYSPGAYDRIGIGITGHVHPDQGIVVRSANLPAGWRNIPLQQRLAKKFKKPVRIDNDANCVALAEALVGAGKAHNAVFSMTIGTGIGAGYVEHQKIFRGGNDAVEFGHIIIDQGRSLEDLVSGPLLARQYFQRTGTKKTSPAIVAAARAGNKTASALIAAQAVWLSAGIANALNCFSPDIVVLGGGMSEITELVRPAIRRVKKIMTYPELAAVPITITALGYQAGVLGAALLYQQRD